MDVSQSFVSFDDLRLEVEKTILALLTGGSVSRATWNDRVLDVYNLCLHPRLKLGQRLYRHIRNLLGSFVSQVQQRVYSCGAENFPIEYERFWLPYHACIPYLDQLFGFLNDRVIRKHKLDQANLRSSYRAIPSDDDDMLEIGELALDLWYQAMVELQREHLTAMLLNEVSRDRGGQIVNHRAVRTVIISLIEMMQLRPNGDSFKLYEEVFEVPFYQMSTELYIHTSLSFRQSSDCSDFMTKVFRFLNDEILLFRKFLHAESQNKALFDCRQHLVVFNIPFLNDSCQDMVQREKWEDLRNMYELLRPGNCTVDNALDTLVTEFEDHVEEIGLAVMQSLQGDDLANQFVEAILDFLLKYREKVEIIFDKNTRFVNALDKACAVAINFKRHPKASCRSPDLLAKYCDDLMKKSTKNLTESEMDTRLNQVLSLFNYISDKDIFQKLYSRSLAKRLIFGQFQSMDLEEAMISHFKQICGYEYTNKLQRMFTDMAISTDLNTKFSSFLSTEPDRQLSHGVYINILADGFWPIVHSNLPTFSLPQELEKCVRMFEMFYNEQFCGRKLTWLYNLSLVELKFCYCKKPYIVTMEMYLMGVLLCFNTADKMSYRDIRDSCQLPNKELLKQLQLLIDSKILLAPLPITDSSVFTLNLKFANKRTKFKLLPTAQTEVVQEIVQTHIAVEEDRRIFLQAAVVRTMKARKEMTHTNLIQEVINQSKARFVPKVSTIKKCIEILIEKQYIERSQKAESSYIYVA